MKRITNALLLALLFAPTSAFALCTNAGFSIVYVNGILTTQAEAANDVSLLKQIVGATFQGEPVQIYNGFNPSHLDGVGDVLESVSQAFNAPISDHDLDTILVQLAQQVTARKLLLVGHSQGTFYANELYDYLVQHGASPNSVTVYDLATPADHVAGAGAYLTSSNDKVIKYVRNAQAELHAPQALAANITIPKEPDYDADAWGGHLPDVYFNGAADAIRAGIDIALGGLTASGNSNTCFAPPAMGLSYEAQQTIFSIADPATAEIESAASIAGGTVSAVYTNANDMLHTAISDAFFSVFPKPNAENAGAAFSVEKALYGSSLSESDYEALLQGQDPEDVPSIAPPPEPPAPSSESPAPQQQTVVQAPSQPVPPPASIATVISISPGFGGGGEPAATASPQSSPAQDTPPSATDGTDESAASTTPVDTVDSSSTVSTSSTSTDDVAPIPADATSTSATSTQPTAVASCGEQSLDTDGFFFSDAKDDAEYSAAGFLEYHFTNQSSGSFLLGFHFYDDQCNASAPYFSAQEVFAHVNVPANDMNWSVRFTSLLHFDIWDDDNGSIVTSGDVGIAIPVYTAVSFSALVVDGVGGKSEFTSRGLKIEQNGEPPFVANSVTTPAGCSGPVITGYFFDPTYENAEYVDGLLRIHLRLQTPDNDGRLFRSTVVAVGSDCQIPFINPPAIPSVTMITPYIRYYSLRMASSTHWTLWDDENDVALTCDTCSGDIPDGAAYVTFYANIDNGGSTLLTPPLPPTQ